MEFLPWEYVRWDSFNPMYTRLFILAGIGLMFGLIGTIFVFICAGQIDSLRKRVKSLENIIEESLEIRRTSIDGIRDEVHEVNSKLKTTGD